MRHRASLGMMVVFAGLAVIVIKLLPAFKLTAIKLAEKTPSPAGEGWGEGESTTRKPFNPPPHPSLLPQGRRG
jgi:hypothetical protein